MLLQQIRKTLANSEERGDVLLRTLASYPDWFLAVDEQNCALLWSIEGKQTLGVMTERNGPDAAPHQYLEMRGRHLMSVLPEETEMIGFDMGTEHGICIQGEGLGRLKNIALALDCEESLSTPRIPSTESDVTSDVGKIVQHEWIALWNKTQPLLMPYKGLNGVMLFTAFDTIDSFLSEQPDPTTFQLNHMHGEDLFRLLDARSDFDGVFINPGSDLELFPFAPAQIHELANGRQPRPERKILRARSIAELNHFLDECGMEDNRPHSTEYVRDQLVEHYTGDTLPGLEARTYRFYPVTDSASDGEWGEGATEIVCAGKLADLLRRRLEILEDEPKPIGAELKPFLQTTIVWANELRKLIDPTTDKLPRHRVRTVDGARFLREYPQIAVRHFVDSALAKLRTL